MMIDAGIKEDLRQKLWAEAANICIDLNNILVNNKKDKSSYQNFYNISKYPPYVNHPRQFGEVGFVLKRGKKIKSKISDRGKMAVMVGYVRNSSGDTYRVFHLNTERVTGTRAVKWTNKLYGEMIDRKISKLFTIQHQKMMKLMSKKKVKDIK